MGEKAIADAHNIGVKYLRVAATGFAPITYGQRGDLDLWRSDARSYWAIIDEMMSDLAANEVKIIPSFVWNLRQFPSMMGEEVSDLIKNPESKSYRMLIKYVQEFVKRYKGHPALMFYELGNELNLKADVDNEARCQPRRAACTAKDNFSTDDLILFTSRLAGLIKGLDSAHAISSGYSAPRPSAQHLRLRPEWFDSKSMLEADTVEEFQTYLLDTHANVDIISAHLYPFEGQRFGSKDPVEFLSVLKAATDRIKKPLFVGEFGQVNVLTLKPGSYPERIMSKIVELHVPYSAAWVWEFYQGNPYTTYDTKPDSFNLEPGYTDRLIEKLKQANSELGNPVPTPMGADTTVPRLVLTWPIECTQLKVKQKIYAVASDDRGKVSRVEFWLDSSKLKADDAPPYEFDLSTNSLAKGDHEIIAKAVDLAGNQSEWKTTVFVEQPSPGSFCASATRQH